MKIGEKLKPHRLRLELKFMGFFYVGGKVSIAFPPSASQYPCGTPKYPLRPNSQPDLQL